MSSETCYEGKKEKSFDSRGIHCSPLRSCTPNSGRFLSGNWLVWANSWATVFFSIHHLAPPRRAQSSHHVDDGHQTSPKRCGSLGLSSGVGFPIFTHLRPGSTIANASDHPFFQKVHPRTRTPVRKNRETNTVR